MRSPTALLLLGIVFPGVAAAAEAPAVTDVHAATSPDIVVTAPYERDRASVLSGVSVLQGTELTREIRSTIGETLARLPGVSATSFGPNASRPVLRGFQGERVRVLTDGIGSFDVSNTSVDHAVIVNPQLAERIEVLHGPASLLYGSSAVGGVVNILDKRIPRSVPEEAVHFDLLGSFGSAATERNFGAVVDVPVTSKVVVHVDGSYEKSDDLRIGSSVLSRQARAQALSSEDPAARDLANLRGRLPNSAGRTWQVAAGAAVIDDGGELGFAVSRYDSVYDVPARYDLATGDGEFVHLAVKQTRVDARAQLNFDGGLFDKLSARFGFGDYRHQELGAQNQVNTTFLNKSAEARVELSQAKHGSWRGAIGLQGLYRDFNIIGAEAFVPKNETLQGGVFTLQEADVGPLHVEASGRYEHTNVKTIFATFRDAPNAFDRSFDALSGSIGASLSVRDGWRVGVNLSRTERAPGAEELLANGPHAGTQAYEIGDRKFRTEKGLGAEIVLRAKGEGYTFEGSVYYNRFRDYIFETQTGAVDEASGLPVFLYRSGRSRYFGAEVQGTVTVAKLGSYDLAVDALADYTDARLLNGGGPVPRIPPLRVLGGVGLAGDRLDARVEAEYATKQKRVTAFETPTDSYTLVNASASFKPFTKLPGTSIVVSANNLFDVDARRHASFLKDFAPLAGRDFRVSLRVVL